MGLTETRIMVMLLDGENNNPGANHEKTLSQLQTHPYQSRQIVAFHVGDRSGQSAKALWKAIPEWYRQHATFYTDGWCAYGDDTPQQCSLQKFTLSALSLIVRLFSSEFSKFCKW
jgi:hypothetical protein